MKISTFKWLFKQALLNIYRNTTSSVSSVVTFLLALFILELSFILLWNIKDNSIDFKPEVQVFLQDNIRTENKTKIYDDIKKLNGVTNVSFQNKKYVLAYLKRHLGNDFKSTSFKESYIVKIKETNHISLITSKIKIIKGIAEVDENRDIKNELSSIIRLLQYLGTPIFIIFSAISLFLINNTIKLSVYLRLEEIKTMKLIGATEFFIIYPLVLQGILLGLLGSSLSLLISFLLYNFIYKKIAYYSVDIFLKLISPYSIIADISFKFILCGIIIGAVTSIFSAKNLIK